MASWFSRNFGTWPFPSRPTSMLSRYATGQDRPGRRQQRLQRLQRSSLPSFVDEQSKPLMAASEDGDEKTSSDSDLGENVAAAATIKTSTGNSISYKKLSSMFSAYLRIVAALVASSLLLALFGLGIRHLLFQQPNNSPISSASTTMTTRTRIMKNPCGSTSAEARAAGCHFDVISFCWLPTECYDSQLSQDFDAENDLRWFLDPDRQRPVTHDKVMTGEYTGLYVNWEYHLRHCTGLWDLTRTRLVEIAG